MIALAPLRLAGAGTEFVESIASYVIRLAYTHGVSPLKVHKLVCSTITQGDGPRVSYGSLLLPATAGYSPAVEVYVRRLGELTRQRNLASGTLLKLSPMLALNGTAAVVNRMRWCPACLGGSETDAPELLIWQLVTVHVCPRDGVELRISCPKCGAPRAPLRGVHIRRYCHRCGQDLTRVDAQPSMLGPFSSWQQAQSVELVRLVARDDWEGVDSEGLSLIVNGFKTENRRTRPARRLRMPTMFKFLRRFRKRAARPTLSTFFLAAAELGVSPAKIFEAPLVVLQARLLDAVPQQRPHTTHRKVPLVAKQKLCEAMRHLMASDVGLLPTLRQLCSAAGMRASSLYQFDKQIYCEYSLSRRQPQPTLRHKSVSAALWTAFFVEVFNQRKSACDLDVLAIEQSVMDCANATQEEKVAMLRGALSLVSILGSFLSPSPIDSVTAGGRQ